MLVAFLFLPRHMRDILLKEVSTTVELPSVLLIRTLWEAVEGMIIITPMQVRDILLIILLILIILPILTKSYPILC